MDCKVDSWILDAPKERCSRPNLVFTDESSTSKWGKMVGIRDVRSRHAAAKEEAASKRANRNKIDWKWSQMSGFCSQRNAAAAEAESRHHRGPRGRIKEAF